MKRERNKRRDRERKGETIHYTTEKITKKLQINKQMGANYTNKGILNSQMLVTDLCTKEETIHQKINKKLH